jgi:hypothetical protein
VPRSRVSAYLDPLRGGFRERHFRPSCPVVQHRADPADPGHPPEAEGARPRTFARMPGRSGRPLTNCLRKAPSRKRTTNSLSKPRWEEPELRPVTHSVHTPPMTLKNAALLALIGTVLMTALLVWNFVFFFLNLLRGLVPAVTLFTSFIYAFGSFSVMVFFFVFHRAQR